MAVATPTAMTARIAIEIATIVQSRVPAIGHRRHDHPADRRGDDGQQPEPQEAGRIEGDELGAERGEVERRAGVERRDPVRDHQRERRSRAAPTET